MGKNSRDGQGYDDNEGNVAQKTTDGATTTYACDYANRLIALGFGGATTTYRYDAFGQECSFVSLEADFGSEVSFSAGSPTGQGTCWAECKYANFR
jgi:YD repeat-containing protein